MGITVKDLARHPGVAGVSRTRGRVTLVTLRVGWCLLVDGVSVGESVVGTCAADVLAPFDEGRVVPFDDYRRAPKVVLVTTRDRWSAGDRHGEHVFVCRMRLVGIGPGGPKYAGAEVLSETGRPPMVTGARNAPTAAGFSWEALRHPESVGLTVEVA